MATENLVVLLAYRSTDRPMDILITIGHPLCISLCIKSDVITHEKLWKEHSNTKELVCCN